MDLLICPLQNLETKLSVNSGQMVRHIHSTNIKKNQLRVNKQLHMASYLNPLSHIKGNWLNAVAFVALRKIQDGLLRRA
jgi:hypothetical protein